METLKIDDEKYCKIFVDSVLKEEVLLEIVTRFIKGKNPHRFSICNDYVYIYFKINTEADDEMKLDTHDGFLFYRYVFEIYSEPRIDFKTYIEHLKKLIDFLRTQGTKAIPVCYFNDLSSNEQNYEDYLNNGKNYTEFMK